MRYHYSGAAPLGRFEKIINKARETPKNLKFREFCYLLEHFEMELRKSSGSHRVYKRINSPKFTISVQNFDGMAKPYQVRQFINKLFELGLIKERKE